MSTCPKCHSIDKVSKVSAIISGGTHHISGEVPVSRTYKDSDGWHESTSYENYNATQQTTLARKLMPPKEPVKEMNGLSLFLGFFALPAILGTVVSSTQLGDAKNSEDAFWALAGIIGALAYLFIAWRIHLFVDKPLKEKISLEKEIWKQSMLKWEKLYYCSRDDCIFFPDENKSFDIANLYQAINWYTIKPKR